MPRLNPLGYNARGSLSSSFTDLGGGRSRGATNVAALWGASTQFSPSLAPGPGMPPNTIFRRPNQIVETQKSQRWDFRGILSGLTRGLGVSAVAPSTTAIQRGPSVQAVAPAGGTPGQNVVNPLFGRPGFTYTRPLRRIGPIPKLSVGTGNTGGFNENRALGLVYPGYSPEDALGITQRELGMNLMDYLPPTVGWYGGKKEINSSVIPRTINVGVSGHAMEATYKPHDFTPADRFFKHMRSSAMWTDGAFPPEYRYLLTRQQVARYNLYTEMALSKPPGPSAYFYGYSTQPYQASQLGGSGSRTLGYG